MESAKAAVTNTSPTTKLLCLVVVVFYLLSKLSGVRELITITPGAVVPPMTRIWTLVTAAFMETHLSNVFIDIIAFIVAGSLFEPLWGRNEYLKFMAVVVLATNTAVVMTFIFLYAATERLELLFFQFSGLAAVLTAFTVAFRQSFPSANYAFLRINFDNSKGPMFSLVVCAVLAGVGLIPTSQMMLAVYGMIVSWVYLRFYQRRNGSKGDSADTFAFAEFFPSPLQPIVNAAGTILFNILVAIHVCSNTRPVNIDEAAPVNVVIPGSNISDAERRKQIALRDLNSRLKMSEIVASNIEDVTSPPPQQQEASPQPSSP